MGKKDPIEMGKQRERFLSGCRERGIDEPTAIEVFKQMEYFAGYGFPKAHATAYALLTFQTAYLKASHPREFLAALMSSMDSQFVCLGTMFTHDIVMHVAGEKRFTDAQQIALGRGFIVLVVAVTYLFSLLPFPNVFDLAVWCFSGFASLFPLVLASIYWRRVTRAGAIASVLVAATTWAILFFVVPLMTGRRIAEDYTILGMMPVSIMVVASGLTLVVVSLVTKPPPDRIVDRFFDLPSTRSVPSTERG